ncbi:MAG: hypothetical protein RL722_1781 [Pseudomonadota bacterium]|jgi:DNA-binding LacI/PurR family transcriptional regulator
MSFPSQLPPDDAENLPEPSCGPSRSRQGDAGTASQAAVPPPPGQRVQMADVARLAGVSVATVSRALNGSHDVGLATRDRIVALARSLNYSVNVGAKNLRMRQNRTLAVVIPYDDRSRQQVSDPFFSAMLGSLADAASDCGHALLFSRIDAAQMAQVAQPWESGAALGVIVIGQWRQHEVLNRLAQRQVPLVIWGAEMPGQRYCSVGGDNRGGGVLVTRHLIERGCRRIAFLGDPDLPEVMMRLQGHQAALAEAGLPAEPSLILPVPFEMASARSALAELLAREAAAGRSLDGVFACSDLLAMTATQVLQAQGLTVPDDVAVAGYDDLPIAAQAEPPLTSVRQPIARAAECLVAALLDMVAGRAVPPCTLPVELVVRASSHRPRAPMA